MRAGFDQSKDAAESLNIKPGTYRTYEYDPAEKNGREPSLTELQRICRKFKVSWVWVASGQGTPDEGVIKNERLQELADSAQSIPEEDQDAAWRAALGALQAFARKAG
jgi:transcriptional regulator with XRE-family HTH domain